MLSLWCWHSSALRTSAASWLPCVLLDYFNAFPELLKVVAHTLQIQWDYFKTSSRSGKCSGAFWSGLHRAPDHSGYSWTGLGGVVCMSTWRGGYSWGWWQVQDHREKRWFSFQASCSSFVAGQQRLILSCLMGPAVHSTKCFGHSSAALSLSATVIAIALENSRIWGMIQALDCLFPC